MQQGEAPLVPRPSQQFLSDTRKREHPRCMVCSPTNPVGLQLGFHVCSDGGVEAQCPSNRLFEGYAGQLHGGLISAVMDAAMCNCLFAHGITAVTAELTIQYRLPVATDHTATVRARLTDSYRPLHCLEAELLQNNAVVATAQAKFFERSR